MKGWKNWRKVLWYKYRSLKIDVGLFLIQKSMRKLLLVLVFAFIIPSLDWTVWLSMFPELKATAICESQLDPKAYNHDGGAQARGLFQITRKYHPEVSDKQAFNPYWSLRWAINVWYAGDAAKEWTCYKE